MTQTLQIQKDQGYWRAEFEAMASPCQVLLDLSDRSVALEVATMAWREAKRIERKYSRYRDDNIIAQINRVPERRHEVDRETALLLDYAEQCYRISEGGFDITSGVLRQVWRFMDGATPPSQESIAKVLPLIGWDKLSWHTPVLQMSPGMELDFGGIGKEYAADRCAALLRQAGVGHALVNFGGDIAVVGPRADGAPWRIAIEGLEASRDGMLELDTGAVATSGDTRRFILVDGKRYGHILDPRSGFPNPDSPAVVTVKADTCLEAGMLATISILQGHDTESFLRAQDVEFWVQRPLVEDRCVDCTVE